MIHCTVLLWFYSSPFYGEISALWSCKIDGMLVGAFTPEVTSWRCLLVAVILWQVCCNTRMACRRYRTWHPMPSLYTYTGTTFRCAIHWCGTSHCNTQLPILMSCIRPDQGILTRPSTFAGNAQLYVAVVVPVSQKLGRKCTHPPSLNPGPVACESITLSARPHILLCKGAFTNHPQGPHGQ